MERYDILYQLYDEFPTDRLRQHQEFVDVFPPVDSRVALEGWQKASDELERLKDEVRNAFETGEILAEIAARTTREQAFTALDLYAKYGRSINVLVLDVDETLRSAGHTDNEIPRETLYLLRQFHEDSVPIVICTGQTLENVKGFTIQGLGSELVHSGTMSIVYESGTGAFTPGHGARTKQLLYEDLPVDDVAVFDEVRARVLADAPEEIRRGCHLQGNEFNVTLKPNFEIGSTDAREIVDRALVHLLELLGEAAANAVGIDGPTEEWARTHYAAADQEIEAVLDSFDEPTDADVPAELTELFERIDVAYYEADAAEIASLELNKVVGVNAAFDVLGIDEPFALVMGDSKSDLRVMEWVREHDSGIAAAPDHASLDVLDHVLRTDELIFDGGDSAEMLRVAYALNLLAKLD